MWRYLIAAACVILPTLIIGGWASIELIHREQHRRSQLHDLRQSSLQEMALQVQDMELKRRKEQISDADDQVASAPLSMLFGLTRSWHLSPPSVSQAGHSLDRIAALQHDGRWPEAWAALVAYPLTRDELRRWLHIAAQAPELTDDQRRLMVERCLRYGLPLSLWPEVLATPETFIAQARKLVTLAARLTPDRRDQLLDAGLLLIEDDLLIRAGDRIGMVELASWRQQLEQSLLERAEWIGPANDQEYLSSTTPWGDTIRLALMVRNVPDALWPVLLLVGGSGVVLLFGLVALLRGFSRERRSLRQQQDLVANVSHELKTPLSSILLHGELLQEQRADEDEERERCVAVIVREALRLEQLVGNLLRQRGFLAGSELQRESVELSQIIDDSLASARPLCQRDGCTLVCEGTAECFIQADRVALVQAIVNLIDNARSYGGSKQTITVSTGLADGELHIAVSDQGPGIMAKDQQRIFEPFVRLEHGLTRRRRGVGLGLALVQRIAIGHGGRVSVESEPGRGSRFTIHLPQAEGA